MISFFGSDLLSRGMFPSCPCPAPAPWGRGSRAAPPRCAPALLPSPVCCWSTSSGSRPCPGGLPGPWCCCWPCRGDTRLAVTRHSLWPGAPWSHLSHFPRGKLLSNPPGREFPLPPSSRFLRPLIPSWPGNHLLPTAGHSCRFLLRPSDRIAKTKTRGGREARAAFCSCCRPVPGLLLHTPHR